MKLLFCVACVDIRALDPAGAWTACRCGNSAARWTDPEKGLVECKAKDRGLEGGCGGSSLRIIGLNNRFLAASITPPTTLEAERHGGANGVWRHRHEVATSAPGYIFDAEKRSCWACVVSVGETGDIRWAE